MSSSWKETIPNLHQDDGSNQDSHLERRSSQNKSSKKNSIGQTPALKTRVLHIYKTWSPESFGGVEEVITMLCQHSTLHGIESRTAYLGQVKKPTLKRHLGIRGICFPLSFELASTGFSGQLLWSFNRLIKWADIVHFHFPWPFADVLTLLCRVNKPIVITYHSDIIRQNFLKFLYAPLMYRFLTKAKAVVTTSPNYLATSPVLKKLKTKATVIPLGVEDRTLNPINTNRLAYWKNRLGENFILFLGVMRYYKGLHILIDAAKNIDCNVIIAGAGPIEKELKNHAKQLGIKNVFFIGRVHEADKDVLYRLCALFVFPSCLRSEAFGISLLEAAMYEKPLISCEIGTGTTYINIHEQTGLVVEPSNAQALSQAINRLLANPIERERFGQNARKRFQSLFTAQAMVSAYSHLYTEILNKNMG